MGKTVDACLEDFNVCLKRPAQTPAPGRSGTSGYTLEGYPFGGAIGGGRKWVIIMTLLLAVSLLWIASKNI